MKKRRITLKESEKILKPLIESESFINFNNHRHWPHKGVGENVYRFNVNIISLEMLINIMENEYVKNVYFTPSAPGPGQGMDGISMVYRIYVKYHEIPEDTVI